MKGGCIDKLEIFYRYCLDNIYIYIYLLLIFNLIIFLFLQKQKYKMINPIVILNLGIYSFFLTTLFFLGNFYGWINEIKKILIIYIFYLFGILCGEFFIKKSRKKKTIAINKRDKWEYKIIVCLYIILLVLNFSKGIPLLMASRYNVEYTNFERVLIFFPKEVFTIWLSLFIVKNYLYNRKIYKKTIILVIFNLIASGLKTSFIIVFFIIYYYFEYYNLKKSSYLKIRNKIIFGGVFFLSFVSCIYWKRFKMNVLESIIIRFINSGDSLYIFYKSYFSDLESYYQQVGVLRYLFSYLYQILGYEKIYSIGEYSYLIMEKIQNRGGPVDSFPVVFIIFFKNLSYILAFGLGIICIYFQKKIRNIKNSIWSDYKYFSFFKLSLFIIPLSMNSIFAELLTYFLTGFILYVLSTALYIIIKKI